MPKFREQSIEKLLTCHPDLITLFNIVISFYDCQVIYGRRNEKEQEEAFSKGNTQLHFPYSKHNKSPSLAIDVLPFPIDWTNKERIILFAGKVLGMANILYDQTLMKNKMRWGGDWNQDFNPMNERFFDGAHFEII